MEGQLNAVYLAEPKLLHSRPCFAFTGSVYCGDELVHKTDDPVADHITAFALLKGKSNEDTIIASVSRRQLLVSQVRFGEEGKLEEELLNTYSFPEDCTVLHVVGHGTCAALFYKDGAKHVKLCVLDVAALKRVIQSLSDITQAELLDLGYEAIPVSVAISPAHTLLILYEAPSGQERQEDLSPAKKVKVSRQQHLVFFDLKDTTSPRMASLACSRHYTTVSCSGEQVCLADELGALYWANMDDVHMTPCPADHQLQSVLTTTTELDRREIRVHWHNRAISALDLHEGFTFSGGEQSKLICWDNVTHNRTKQWTIGDGPILRIDASQLPHVLITTGTNKMYSVDTRLARVPPPVLIGPPIPVVPPFRLISLTLEWRLLGVCPLYQFLRCEQSRYKCQRLELDNGACVYALSLLYQLKSTSRKSAHDADIRLFSPPSQEHAAPFASSFIRAYKKHNWSRPDSSLTNTKALDGYHADAHYISAVGAIKNALLIAETTGVDLHKLQVLRVLDEQGSVQCVQSITLSHGVVDIVSNETTAIVVLDNAQLVEYELQERLIARRRRKVELTTPLTYKRWQTYFNNEQQHTLFA